MDGHSSSCHSVGWAPHPHANTASNAQLLRDPCCGILGRDLNAELACRAEGRDNGRGKDELLHARMPKIAAVPPPPARQPLLLLVQATEEGTKVGASRALAAFAG